MLSHYILNQIFDWEGKSSNLKIDDQFSKLNGKNRDQNCN
jgi:hypothetical protein